MLWHPHAGHVTPRTSATSTAGDAGWVAEKEEQHRTPLAGINLCHWKKTKSFAVSKIHCEVWPVLYVLFLDRAVALFR